MSERLYHYTVGAKLAAIVESLGIKLSPVSVIGQELYAAWFTYSPEWEETANKGVIVSGRFQPLTREGTRQKCGGLVRIEVRPESAPLTFEQWVEWSGVNRFAVRALTTLARRHNSDTSLWRVAVQPVSVADFLNIEVQFVQGEPWTSVLQGKQPRYRGADILGG